MSNDGCMFCESSPCECVSSKKKTPSKRVATPRKSSTSSSPPPPAKPTRRIKPRTGSNDASVSASDSSHKRLDAETLEAVKMLNFVGLLAQSEQKKWAHELEPGKATGKYIEGGEQWSSPSKS